MIVNALALLALSLSARDPRILFIGNSHTQVNDLPNMVRTLLESDGHGRAVTVKRIFIDFLNDLSEAEAKDNLKPGAWDIVVLQGALLSSSHQYHYSQKGGIALAKMAVQSGARTLLFAEWPRRDWDEADFIVDGYQEIAGPSHAEIVDVPHVFDVVHKQFPTVELWQPDGNHASYEGTLIAACTICRWIEGASNPDPPYANAPGDPGFVRVADKAALAAFKKWHPKG